MLLGREHETARMDRLLDGAREGRAGALVVRGEPGIGKTALLDYAADRAEGMTVLAARGIEAEAELPFAALADLLRPVLTSIERIPEAQAAALRAALALGPPAAGDRFTVCAAVLSLLAAAADESPVLVLIDDAHCIDRSSMQAVLFAARRLDAEGIAVVIAQRDDPDLDVSGLQEVELRGLRQDAAAALLQRSGPVADEVAEKVIAASGANPLALIEIPSLLTPAQLTGTEPLDGPIPTGDALERALTQRVAKLPDQTQRALVVAAASGSSDLDEIIAAVERAGLDPDALDAAERAGLTFVDGSRFAFEHPLLRSAVYHGAPALTRRAAHRALAEGSAERRPWHLAAAADQPDAALAAELERSASTARARGGHAEAAATLERAAGLAEDDDERARMLRDAAHEAWRAGATVRALGLLDDGLAQAGDRELVARLQHLYGVVEMWSGSPRAAYERLNAEAERIAATDPVRSARLLTDAGWACFMAGEVIAGRAAAERAAARTEAGGGFAEVLAGGLLGIAMLLGGERAHAEPLLRRHEPLLDDPAFLERSYGAVWPAPLALVWMEEHDKARELFGRVIAQAREQSVPSVLPYTLVGLAELDFRTGGWARSYANAAEAVTLARQTEQPVSLAFALACLARIEAAQGRADDCREHATEAFDLAANGAGSVVVYAAAAVGLLELGAGRIDEAIEYLAGVRTEVEAHGLLLPTVIQWAPDLIEALARAGRADEATELLASFEQAAEACTSTWGLGASARCRGLLGASDDFEADFSRALELQEASGTPFEVARTELCLGERLRRARRRKEARTVLRPAIERFERLGAMPWAERAKAELRASGETVEPGGVIATNELTPQELQVALTVAKGATNREAGAALFLSPKTIEAHLGRVYRKLDVRSRTELAALLAREEVLSAA
jgi:ATP/maltotriose-dependent transcriptional regulator MalT